jgi:Uncharacterized protein conserved in bacteria (DUF2188)
MARAQYFVVLHKNEWKVSFEGHHYGPYRNQAHAIRAAIEAAHADGDNGDDAQVLVQGGDNEFRTEWTYGNDPYPPPG